MNTIDRYKKAIKEEGILYVVNFLLLSFYILTWAILQLLGKSDYIFEKYFWLLTAISSVLGLLILLNIFIKIKTQTANKKNMVTLLLFLSCVAFPFGF